MLPTHRTRASPLEDRLVCVLYLKLSLGRKLSRAQRVERYFISTNPFTSGYERRGIILPIGLGLRAVMVLLRNVTFHLFIIQEILTFVKSFVD